MWFWTIHLLWVECLCVFVWLINFRSTFPVLVLLKMCFCLTTLDTQTLLQVWAQMDKEKVKSPTFSSCWIFLQCHQGDRVVSWPTLSNEPYLQTVCFLHLVHTCQTSTVFWEHSPWDAVWRIHPSTFMQAANRHSLSVWCRLQPRDINEWWQNISCGSNECIACWHKAYGPSPVLRASGASVREQCERSGPYMAENKGTDCTMNGITTESSWVNKGLNSLIRFCVPFLSLCI